MTVDASPFIKDLFLVVSDTCFYFYLKNGEEPVYYSSYLQNSRLTCGKFSVSRASVFFIGREDGIIDIWDFTEQVGVPS